MTGSDCIREKMAATFWAKVYLVSCMYLNCMWLTMYSDHTYIYNYTRPVTAGLVFSLIFLVFCLFFHHHVNTPRTAG
jgi:hypothetical protein